MCIQTIKKLSHFSIFLCIKPNSIQAMQTGNNFLALKVMPQIDFERQHETYTLGSDESNPERFK